jgi:hypothetical protein
LSRTNRIPPCVDPELLAQVEVEIKKVIDIVKELSDFASQYPYYK